MSLLRYLMVVILALLLIGGETFSREGQSRSTESAFEVPVTVSDGTNTQMLTIAVNPLGTPGFDPGLDVLAPPPPPAGGFDARLTWLGEAYFKDVRSDAAAADTFVITYAAETDTQGVAVGPIVLSWDNSVLPALGCFRITDNLTGALFSLDMATTGNLAAGSNPVLNAGIRILLTYPEIFGDVSDDGLANSTDALVVLSYDAGFAVPQQFLERINAGIGDVNSDGVTNSTDALIILSYDAGFPVPFPIGQLVCP